MHRLAQTEVCAPSHDRLEFETSREGRFLLGAARPRYIDGGCATARKKYFRHRAQPRRRGYAAYNLESGRRAGTVTSLGAVAAAGSADRFNAANRDGYDAGSSPKSEGMRFCA